jgi:hypothetical protein
VHWDHWDFSVPAKPVKNLPFSEFILASPKAPFKELSDPSAPSGSKKEKPAGWLPVFLFRMRS